MTDNLREITEFLLYQTEDGCIRIETRMQKETVWLTHDQIAQLFSKDILEEFFKDHIEEYNGVEKKEQTVRLSPVKNPGPEGQALVCP